MLLQALVCLFSSALYDEVSRVISIEVRLLYPPIVLIKLMYYVLSLFYVLFYVLSRGIVVRWLVK